ncbi:Sensor protein ZraS [Rubripirellula lacrimiformis]|uniref:histidine kinase n=1 Tax=Rubripirellula lacrimiformis TaxID=1930273 RepID=A0A517NCV7_9BACT|nr:CHASE sensor domain-containing protein [Rubripirellula lacrimiformis]QDT04963.1 Sensor protein ZraS [Rubripirellula lacrimiformis]
MNWFGNLRIRAKLQLLLTLTTISALGITVAAFLINDRRAAREAMADQLEVLSEVVAENSTAAVMFGDREAATEVLRALRSDPSVQLACIFDTQGKPFAAFDRNQRSQADPLAIQIPGDPPRLPDWVETLPRPNKPGLSFHRTTVTQVAAIVEDSESMGFVYLQASTAALGHRTNQNLKVALFAMLAATLVTTVIARRLEQAIAKPIVRLAMAANDISKREDYSVRVVGVNDDEIGLLYSSFNNMLQQIETSRDDLHVARDHLEDRVEQRTAQLTQANVQLTSEIAERARAQREIEELHHQLVDTARRAGMADVATGVLHNVGNILNSVNVSAGLLSDRLAKPPVEKLNRSIELLRLIQTDMDDSGVGEVRPGKLAVYLDSVVGGCTRQAIDVDRELNRLVSNIDHIKKVVASQQSMAKSAGLVLEQSMSSLFEEALQLHDAGLSRHNIRVEAEFEEHPKLLSDKHRILQVLVNLVANAKQAMIGTAKDKRVLRLKVRDIDGVSVRATVQDTGHGISPENLSQVFSYGFTTKVDGHGFGLHASALAAYELGGTLNVESEGEGLGATFCLELPYQNIEEWADAASS